MLKECIRGFRFVWRSQVSLTYFYNINTREEKV